MPEVVVLHLKRFRAFGENREKIDAFVAFPKYLDFAPHCAGPGGCLSPSRISSIDVHDRLVGADISVSSAAEQFSGIPWDNALPCDSNNQVNTYADDLCILPSLGGVNRENEITLGSISSAGVKIEESFSGSKASSSVSSVVKDTVEVSESSPNERTGQSATACAAAPLARSPTTQNIAFMDPLSALEASVEDASPCSLTVKANDIFDSNAEAVFPLAVKEGTTHLSQATARGSMLYRLVAVANHYGGVDGSLC